jgi:hypothetical protein
MKISGYLSLVLASLIAGRSAADPPNLTSTSPVFWAVGVNAAQKNVSLTFDQHLRSGFWDWFGRDSLSPASALHIVMSSDGLTCSIDVKLQAGKVYVMGLNERGIPGVGFQNERGFSLRPTFLVFQTAGPTTPEDAPPKVVKTIPSNGATALDSTKLQSVAISFDTPMNPKKHGLHLFEDNQPVDISRAPFQYSLDGKTFTLAYAFKPSKTYKLELNNIHDIGFSGATRIPLWPVNFTFTTEQQR